MFRFKKGSRGFTLVELMVVMAIMAVLAGIVFPAVTGTKGPSESTQVQSDAQAVQTAAAKFNNDAATLAADGKPPWPEIAVGAGTAYGLAGEVTMITTAVGGSSFIGSYTAVDWVATTKIRNANGALVPVFFVPDFVPRVPASVNDLASSTSHTFVWLLKAGAATDAPNRSVEVYKLNDGGTAYTKIY